MSAPVVTPSVVVDANASVFPYVGFAAGTKITCKIDGTEQTVAVEDLKPGMLVKAHANGFRPVDKIGYRTFANPGSSERLAQHLYVLPKVRYPSLTSNLTITGTRSVLIPVADDAQKEQMIAVHGTVSVTDRRYGLPCAADANATLHPIKGNMVIYNFSLVGASPDVNYGVFANGLLVDNSSAFHMMKKAYTLIQ